MTSSERKDKPAELAPHSPNELALGPPLSPKKYTRPVCDNVCSQKGDQCVVHGTLRGHFILHEHMNAARQARSDFSPGLYTPLVGLQDINIVPSFPNMPIACGCHGAVS